MQSKLTVVAPLNEVAPVPPNIKLAVPSVNVNASTEVNVIAFAFKLVAVEAVLPILIDPVVALELNDILPVQSKLTVVAPLNEVAPVPSNIKLAIPSVNVNASTEVNVIAFAFKLVAVEASLPIVMVFATSCVPILIAAGPRVSIAKVPPELRDIVVAELRDIAVVESNTIVPAESNSIASALIFTLVDAAVTLKVPITTALPLVVKVPRVLIVSIPEIVLPVNCIILLLLLL